ncbi:MAG: SDR family NAD(P)-dependent oxidoreductase [Myxococcaceae bacterium]|nr:SDR family NAD(P)-dependent oxidoreductase [Myxococcaceae bacterium]
MKPGWLGLGLVAAAGAVMLNRLRRPHRLRGRLVLITGGSRGLGLELARVCLDRGARVALLGRDADTLATARASLGDGVFTFACDVADRGAVRAAVDTLAERAGDVDVVIHCAGQIQVGPLKTMTPADYQRSLDTHLFGAIHVVDAVLPSMRERRAGNIVLVSSVGGLVAVPHLTPYSTSKFALAGYAEGLRAELANDGICVTAVYPGLMRTGSPRNADFKGRHEREYAWFTIAGSLPFVSMSVQKAARSIVAACERGQASLNLMPLGRVLLTLKAWLPGVTAALMSGFNRALPRGGDAPGTGSRKGHESESFATRSPLTLLTRRAELSQNQR